MGVVDILYSEINNNLLKHGLKCYNDLNDKYLFLNGLQIKGHKLKRITCIWNDQLRCRVNISYKVYKYWKDIDIMVDLGSPNSIEMVLSAIDKVIKDC